MLDNPSYQLMRVFFSREFFLFLVTGGIAALVNFISRIIYGQWMSFSAAVIVAYITGMVAAFVLFRLFVFKGSRRGTRRSAVYFTLVNLLAVCQVWLVSMGMALIVLPALNVTLYVEEIAHAAGILVPAFTSYLGHKYLSFRD